MKIIISALLLLQTFAGYIKYAERKIELRTHIDKDNNYLHASEITFVPESDTKFKYFVAREFAETLASVQVYDIYTLDQTLPITKKVNFNSSIEFEVNIASLI